MLMARRALRYALAVLRRLSNAATEDRSYSHEKEASVPSPLLTQQGRLTSALHKQPSSAPCPALP